TVAASVGAAIAINAIANTVNAMIAGSIVSAANEVRLNASSRKRSGSTSPYRLDALALGISDSTTVAKTPRLTGAFAGAGSAAVNRVDNHIESSITDNSNVHADTDIVLAATDDSSVRADSGGFALGLAVPLGPGIAASAALGAAYSENQFGANGGSAV